MAKVAYNHEKLQVIVIFDDIEEIMSLPLKYVEGLAGGAFLALRAACVVHTDGQENKDA